MFIKSCSLALYDYWHEKLLSLCSILSLAAVLAPLLVLYGVKFGVINTMTERLKNDPRNLEIIPIGSGNYTKSLISELANNIHVDFILPRTRAIAATMSLSLLQETSLLKRITVSLEPTASNDTLLRRYLPNYLQTLNINIPTNSFGIILSFEAAQKLNAKPQTILQGRVERSHNGQVQKAIVKLFVLAVLPLEAQQKSVAFVPLPLLEATEDFRDGRRPIQDIRLNQDAGWTGENLPNTQRIYSAFRLYAKDLDSVGPLRDYLLSQGIEVYTQAGQIASIRSLDASLNIIFGLIGIAAAFGFVASTSSNAFAAVRRKERYLGILRLVGYNSKDIMAFALFQTLLTATFGSILALALYFITALTIDKLFADSLQGIEKIAILPPLHFFIAMFFVLMLAFVATLIPAIQAARVEPSEVIREV